MYIWWKEKKTIFLQKKKKKDFSLRIYVQKDWLRDHTSWAPCGIEMKIKGILKSWFWILLHQGTLSILYSRIQGYMLSFMNEVDPCLLLPPCVLYEIENQIFSNTLNLWFGKEYGNQKSPQSSKFLLGDSMLMAFSP